MDRCLTLSDTYNRIIKLHRQASAAIKYKKFVSLPDPLTSRNKRKLSIIGFNSLGVKWLQCYPSLCNRSRRSYLTFVRGFAGVPVPAGSAFWILWAPAMKENNPEFFANQVRVDGDDIDAGFARRLEYRSQPSLSFSPLSRLM